MAAINERLKKLQKQNEDSLLVKGQRRKGTFTFVKVNGNGTHQWELTDIDKDFDGNKLFNIVTSVTDQENEHLIKTKGMSDVYLSQKPRLNNVTGMVETFEGQPVYGLRLDNPVSNMINGLIEDGINRSDLTQTAALKRDFIMNNPFAADILKFKSQFGLTGQAQRPQRTGLTIADLKSEIVNGAPAATEGKKEKVGP